MREAEIDQDEVRLKLKNLKSVVEDSQEWRILGYQIDEYTREDGSVRGKFNLLCI